MLTFVVTSDALTLRQDPRHPSREAGRLRSHRRQRSVRCVTRRSLTRILSHHRRQKHRDAVPAGSPQVTGQWPRSHRRVLTQKVALQLNSITEFLTWKSSEEYSTASRYIKVRRDVRNSQGDVRRVYRCHRSGSYRPRGRWGRQLKVQGTCKIGAICPASLFVRILSTGVVRVDYYSRHQGHPTEVAHLQLRRDECEKVAGMLSLGIPFEDVLDSVQWRGMPAGQLTALNLLTRKEL